MSNPIVDLMEAQRKPLYQAEASSNIYKSEASDLFRDSLKQSPQYTNVMDFIRRNGVSAKAAFYLMCKQRGVDPDQIIGSLKNRP